MSETTYKSKVSYKPPIELKCEKDIPIMEEFARKAANDVDRFVVNGCVKVGVKVDRDELVKALQYDRGQYEKGYAEGVLSATPKWIDASKRLPDKEGSYIVFETQNGEVMEALYSPAEWRKDRRWTDAWEGCTRFVVSHWMEMPEPPQEVKHEVD